MDPKIVFVLLLVAAAVYYYYFMRKQAPVAEPGSDSSLIVYGTMECGWTRKQLKYLDDKGLKYTFVNCKEGNCPPDVTGYPTMIYNGERINGYKELAEK